MKRITREIPVTKAIAKCCNLKTNSMFEKTFYYHANDKKKTTEQMCQDQETNQDVVVVRVLSLEVKNTLVSADVNEFLYYFYGGEETDVTSEESEEIEESGDEE